MTMFDLLPTALRFLVFAVMAGGLLCAVALRVWPPRQSANDFYLSNREADIGHIIMLAAMLVMMALPLWLPAVLWQALFGLLALFYAIRLVQHLRRATSEHSPAALQAGGAGYHLIASLAMLYASTGHSHHGHSHDHASWSLGAGLAWPWLAWLLVALFLIDALLTCVVLFTGRAPGYREQLITGAHRLAVVPHLAMDIAMVLMF